MAPSRRCVARWKFTRQLRVLHLPATLLRRSAPYFRHCIKPIACQFTNAIILADPTQCSNGTLRLLEGLAGDRAHTVAMCHSAIHQAVRCRGLVSPVVRLRQRKGDEFCRFSFQSSKAVFSLTLQACSAPVPDTKGTYHVPCLGRH